MRRRSYERWRRSTAATSAGRMLQCAKRRTSPRVRRFEQNVIDVIAPTLPRLLDKIDGMKTVPRGLVLDTKDANVTEVEMSLWKRILDTLIDPNIIALMLSLGVLGIVVELYNPGLIFPATLGGICLIIGFYGLQVLPVNWAGVLLMLLAAGFWGAEPFVMSHGALALAGAVRSCSAPCSSSIPPAPTIRCPCRSRSGSPARSRSSWRSPWRRSSRYGGSRWPSARQPRRHAGRRAARRSRGGQG